jgi:hypothetical protein
MDCMASHTKRSLLHGHRCENLKSQYHWPVLELWSVPLYEQGRIMVGFEIGGLVI